MFSQRTDQSVQMLRENELRYLANLKAQEPNVQPVFKKLADDGFLALSPVELVEIRRAYPGQHYETDVYSKYDKIHQGYIAQYSSLALYLKNQSALAGDPIKGALYLAANNDLLPKVDGASKTASYKQLQELKMICLYTQKGIVDPSDKANNQAYEELYKRVSGQRSLSSMLIGALQVVVGAIFLALALTTYILAITTNPIMVLPAMLTGIMGALFLGSGVTKLNTEFKSAKYHRYDEAANASRMFNRHLNKHATADDAIKKEESSFRSRVRQVIVGGMR